MRQQRNPLYHHDPAVSQIVLSRVKTSILNATPCCDVIMLQLCIHDKQSATKNKIPPSALVHHSNLSDAHDWKYWRSQMTRSLMYKDLCGFHSKSTHTHKQILNCAFVWNHIYSLHQEIQQAYMTTTLHPISSLKQTNLNMIISINSGKTRNVTVRLGEIFYKALYRLA